MRDAEVTRHQRRGATDQHATALLDLLEQVVGGGEVTGRALPLRELHRQHRPRVTADHRLQRQPGQRRAEHRELTFARVTHREKRSTLACSIVSAVSAQVASAAWACSNWPRATYAHASGGRNSPAAQWYPERRWSRSAAVRVLLGVVVLTTRDRDLRERGERQAELQRVLRAVGDVDALLRRVYGLVEAAHPREHERHPEHGTTREQRVVVRGACVRDSPSSNVASEPRRS